MTFFKVFDVPVFWPILLIYFCALFLTMKRQIKHMVKHKYVPWVGKTKYSGKKDKFDPLGGKETHGRFIVDAEMPFALAG